MKRGRHPGQHLCAIPFPCFIQLLSITALKVHYLMSRDELLPTAVGKTRVQGLVCTSTQYQLGIVGCRRACSSIAMLLGTTLTCGSLAMTAYSVLYATCVATTAHAILGADNNSSGATSSEAAEALQLSNHLEVASLASLSSTTQPFFTMHQICCSFVSRRFHVFLVCCFGHPRHFFGTS